MRKRILLLLFALLMIGPDGDRLCAQATKVAPDLMGMSLEDLMKVEIDSVYGASGYKQKVSDAPASITIITAEEIKRYGYRTLADVLRDVPGFYVTNDRNYDYVGVRGFGRPGDYNSRILLLIDGHRANDSIYDQAYIGTDFPIDLDLIDRIEVIRGPNSTLYVASALLGVINIVTKTVHDAPGVTLSGELASYGTFKSRITYGHEFGNGLAMLLSATYYDSHGQNKLYFQEFDTPTTHNGIAEDADGDLSHQAFVKFSYHNLTLEGGYGFREKQVPTASFGTIFNDSEERTTDAAGYLNLKYDHHFSSDWGYIGRLEYSNQNYLGMYPYNNPQGDSLPRILNVDTAHGQWWGGEFALSKKLFENQTLIAGTEFRDNFRQDQSNYDAEPYYQYFNSRQSCSILGFYVQDAIRVHNGLHLDLGIRTDHYSTFGATTNPRAALIYQPFEKTNLKFLYGQSFRAPNAYELYYAGQGQEPNLSLKPETAKTMELVLEQGVYAGFHVVASGYYYPIRGLIGATTDPVSEAIIYENSQRVDMKGLEFTLKRQSSSGLEIGISLSLEYAKDINTGSTLTNSPRVLGQANLSVPLFKRKLFASTNLEYVSKRQTLEGGFAGAYFVPNLTLFSHGALRGWDFSASSYNAFDSIYGDPGSVEHEENVIPQDGRNFRLKLTYHL